MNERWLYSAISQRKDSSWFSLSGGVDFLCCPPYPSFKYSCSRVFGHSRAVSLVRDEHALDASLGNLPSLLTVSSNSSCLILFHHHHLRIHGNCSTAVGERSTWTDRAKRYQRTCCQVLLIAKALTRLRMQGAWEPSRNMSMANKKDTDIQQKKAVWRQTYV